MASGHHQSPRRLTVLLSALLLFHILAAIVWVGGMFFAYVILRPVLGNEEGPQRLRIWVNVLSKFFPWVSASIGILFLTGFAMIYLFGGFSSIGVYIYIMLILAILMAAIFKFILVAPFQHLKRGVEEQKWETAAYALGTIRKLVLTNLTIGVIIILNAIALKTI